MSLIDDFIRTHSEPSIVFAKKVPHTGDARAFAYLMLACLLMFMSRIPSTIAGQGAHSIDRPTGPTLAALFLGAMIAAPMMFYLYAAAIRLLMMMMGGRIAWLHSRVVVFWSLLVVSPWVVIAGLITGYVQINMLETIETVALISFFTFLLYKGYRITTCSGEYQT